MRKNREDLTKQNFGLLTVVEIYNTTKKGVNWICNCDCGNFAIVLHSRLKSGATKSCGCLKIAMMKNIVTKTEMRQKEINKTVMRFLNGKN